MLLFTFSDSHLPPHTAVLTVELVQPPQVIEQRFQRLGDRKELQEAVDDDVKDRQEAQTHVPEVDWQVLRLQLHGRVDLVRETLKVQLLWVFLRREQLTQPFHFKPDPVCVISGRV